MRKSRRKSGRKSRRKSQRKSQRKSHRRRGGVSQTLTPTLRKVLEKQMMDGLRYGDCACSRDWLKQLKQYPMNAKLFDELSSLKICACGTSNDAETLSKRLTQDILNSMPEYDDRVYDSTDGPDIMQKTARESDSDLDRDLAFNTTAPKYVSNSGLPKAKAAQPEAEAAQPNVAARTRQRNSGSNLTPKSVQRFLSKQLKKSWLSPPKTMDLRSADLVWM